MNRTILNLELDHQYLLHGIAARAVSLSWGGIEHPPNGRIEFFDFARGQSIPIFALDKPASGFGGLALSPDGKSFLFGQNELNKSYIMIMKNFR